MMRIVTVKPQNL